MSEWSDYLGAIQRHVADLKGEGCDLIFYRGHNNGDWPLLCGLGRQNIRAKRLDDLEAVLYYDFLSLAGAMTNVGATSWDVLFAMQHHGVPTRLLDWSGTFSVALYFALRPFLLNRNKKIRFQAEPCVWVLNPFTLNEASTGEASILNPNIDLHGSYYENFIARSKKMGSDILAVNPTQVASRLAVQRGVFTIHSSPATSMEAAYSAFLKKFSLPKGAITDALDFLSMAGVNEFSLFPDLDGLGRYLATEHLPVRLRRVRRTVQR